MPSTPTPTSRPSPRGGSAEEPQPLVVPAPRKRRPRPASAPTDVPEGGSGSSKGGGGKDRGGADTGKKLPGRWHLFFRKVCYALSALAALALVVCSYAGHISPAVHSAWWGVFPLLFPFAFWGTLLMLVLMLVFCRRAAIIVGAGLLCCLGAVLDYCPLNIFPRKAAPEARTFKVLTYNVANFHDLWPQEQGDFPRNRTLSYIIDSGADIVCLQETGSFAAEKRLLIHPEDMMLLGRIYPYIIRSHTYLFVLSKYPLESVHTDWDRTKMDAEVGVYRVKVDDELQITLFNVHLQSFRLSYSDYDLYRDLTESPGASRSELRAVKADLLPKLASAARQRARQIDKINRYIEHYGGPNVLVCGDFNDVVNSYSDYVLSEAGLHEVHAEVGFGPTVTYNFRRMYFGIDHIYYRGNMRPLWQKKGTILSSDHWPVTAAFEVGR